MSTISPYLKALNMRDNSGLRRRSAEWGRARKLTIVARTSVGFERAEWHWLCDMAHETDCTISEVIREIIRDAYRECLGENEDRRDV